MTHPHPTLTRMARGIYSATCDWTQNYDTWDQLPEYGRELFYDRARAALTALLDLESDVVTFGRIAVGDDLEPTDDEVRAIFTAMVRHILGDQQ